MPGTDLQEGKETIIFLLLVHFGIRNIDNNVCLDSSKFWIQLNSLIVQWTYINSDLNALNLDNIDVAEQVQPAITCSRHHHLPRGPGKLNFNCKKKKTVLHAVLKDNLVD